MFILFLSIRFLRGLDKYKQMQKPINFMSLKRKEENSETNSGRESEEIPKIFSYHSIFAVTHFAIGAWMYNVVLKE